MDVFEAIRSRRSHRSFSDTPVETEKIDQILEAAQWAPSPANNQPWEFVVVTGDGIRAKLLSIFDRAGQTGSVELHGFSYVRPAPSELNEKTNTESSAGHYSLSFMKNVPVMIAVAGEPNPSIRQGLIDRVKDGYKYACAASIQNMLLAAQALGLGSLWFTFFDGESVKDVLNIDPAKHLVAIICVGYPASTPTSPGRLPLKAKVRRIG